MLSPSATSSILEINNVIQRYFNAHGGTSMSADEAADLIYAAGIMTPDEGSPESRGFTFREFLRQLREMYGYERLHQLLGVTQRNNRPGSHWTVHRFHPPSEERIREILDHPPSLAALSTTLGSEKDPLTLPDHLTEGLDVVFVGTGIGEHSAEEGHYYAHPTDRFWDLVNQAGLVSDLIGSENAHLILDEKCGLTDLVKNRASGSDADLKSDDFDIPGFAAKIQKFKPKVVAFIGKHGYKIVFGAPPKDYGLADEVLGDSWVWILPSSSGSDTSITYEKKLHWYKKLKASLPRF